MSKINYLDISELNDELQELIDKREAIESMEDDLKELKTRLSEPSEDEDSPANIWDEIKEKEEEIERYRLDYDDSARQELLDLKDEIGESRRGLISEDKQLIDENDFEEYAQVLADDIGRIPKDAGWPQTCIDWEWAAKELKYDYSSVDFRGTTYLYRAS